MIDQNYKDNLVSWITSERMGLFYAFHAADIVVLS